MRTPAAVSLRRACVPHFRLGEMHLPQQSDGEEPRSRCRRALRGDVIGRTIYARCDDEAGGNAPARRTPPPRRSIHLADNLGRETGSRPGKDDQAAHQAAYTRAVKQRLAEHREHLIVATQKCRAVGLPRVRYNMDTPG